LLTATSNAYAQDKAISESSTLAGVLDRGTLRVCFEAGFMPFEMVSNKGGLRTHSLVSGDERRGAQVASFVGFDIDLARDMARKLGVDFVPANTRWSAIIPALVLGRCDIIMSGMTITEDRQRRVDFSEPYLMAGQTVLLHKGLKDEVGSYADLNDAKYIIASRAGTTGEEAVQRLLPLAKYQPVGNEAEAIAAVRDGRLSAFVYDLPYNTTFVAMHGRQGLVFLDQPFTEEALGWAIRKHDPDFLDWLNGFLRESKKSGRYDTLYQKWFVSTDWFGDVK
jgi:polar amino acid transport system substrate-binding protein